MTKGLIKVAILGVLMLGTVYFIAVEVYGPSRRAREITATLQATDWANADTHAIERFADKFGGKLECWQEFCQAEIRTTNRGLALLHLAPPMSLRVLLSTNSNKMHDYSVTLRNLG